MREHKDRLLIAILAGVAVAVVVPALVVLVLVTSSGEPTEHRYVVQAGTAERLAAGERVETMPSELDVRVGDRLVIENRDDRTHQVGPFAVRSGETLSHTFAAPGELRDACTIQPDGEIVIRIT